MPSARVRAGAGVTVIALVVAMLSLTTIVVSGLAFTHALVGKQRAAKRLPIDPSASRAAKRMPIDPSAPLPFLLIMQGTRCPRCGAKATERDGMRQPMACSPKYLVNGCRVEGVHLHVSCNSCESRWTMLPSEGELE